MGESSAGAAIAPGKKTTRKKKAKKKGGDTALPVATGANPYLKLDFDEPRCESFALAKTFKGHLNPVSALAFHPKKPIVATVSDDETWKMWSSPGGELIMSGEGHKDWLSGVAFHPSGAQLATCSGDATVKLWDFINASCAATYTDHT